MLKTAREEAFEAAMHALAQKSDHRHPEYRVKLQRHYTRQQSVISWPWFLFLLLRTVGLLLGVTHY